MVAQHSLTIETNLLALFAVKLFGFGPFAGIVALSIATIGFYGKLLAEDIEDMDPVQAEAIKSTGAGWFQWLNYAVQDDFRKGTRDSQHTPTKQIDWT